MRRFKKFASCILILAMLISLCSCAGSRRKGAEIEKRPEASKPETEVETAAWTDPADQYPTDHPSPTPTVFTSFTMFTALTHDDIDQDNEIRKMITEITGVQVTESWLPSKTTAKNAVDSIISSGAYPDFIDAGSDNARLYKNGILIAWDDYLENYPDLKSLYTDEEWDMFRQDDGHIYWANISDRYNGKKTETTHIGQAFWIQVRVLEAYGYPKIETLDQYFELLEKYSKEHPEMPDGTKVIPYTCLCESWKNFCLVLPPMMLDGAPNNQCVIVNADEGMNNPKVIDYNVSDTTKAYYKKLNEEFNKGIIDKDFASQTYDQYIEKLNTGAVLGMSDEYWNFGYNLFSFSTPLKSKDGNTYTLSEIGCDYVPLGLTIKQGMKQQWHTYEDSINTESGIAVTVQCKDPDKAFKFLNDLLSQEIHDLRFWGVRDVDYLVDDQGNYYRTPEMRNNWKNPKYLAKHVCEYSCMPQWKGMSKDGINNMRPSEQPSEFMASLPEPVQNCFKAYGVSNYVEFIGSEYKTDYGKWFPLWSWSNELNAKTDYGKAFGDIKTYKESACPELVKAKKFDDAWKAYVSGYNKCNPDLFLKEAQAEVDRRMR